MSKLTEKERKELYQYAIRIGFIKTDIDEDKYQRINHLISEGYRIMVTENHIDVINIKGNIISKELEDELLELVTWLQE